MKAACITFLVAVGVLPFAAYGQDIEQKVQVCTACHGANGVPVAQAFPVPVIWGQDEGYIFFELRDFKSGARKSDVMQPIAQSLDQAGLLPMAKYFSEKTWPNLHQKPAPADQASIAQTVNTSVVCTSCHQQGFLGSGTQPRLAGQAGAYLQKTMSDFSSGARANNPGMTGFMKGLTDQQIAAMAAWLAGM
jgi:cytochrome c553